ncbi:hypothetical protein BGZ81_001499, partial [Podila clonocystis]
MANGRYSYLTLAKEVERLENSGNSATVDCKNQRQMLEELRDLQKWVPELCYRNIC